MGQVSVDLAGALAVNSTLTYTSAQRKWFDFCKRAGAPPILHRSVVPDPLEAELIVMMFCSFCRLEGVDGDSVSTYVSGVRSLHIDAIGVAPWEPGHRLKRQAFFTQGEEETGWCGEACPYHTSNFNDVATVV